MDGKTGSTVISDAFKKAEEKKTKEAPKTVPLPDLSKIEVGTVSGERLTAINKEAQERKEWAENAGAKLAQIQEEIRKLEGDQNTRFSPTGQQLLAHYKDAEQRLLTAGDESLRQHMEFSKLLNEVRSTDPTHLGEVGEIIFRVCQMGRYKIASEQEVEAGRKEGKWPAGTIFFEKKVYLSFFAEKSSGQRALEAELRKLVDAVKFSKAASIKTRGNSDLSGLVSGKTGYYYLFSPKRTEEDRKFSEGHALVEVKDINKGKTDKKPYGVVEVRDACGSLGWMAEDRGRWIPFLWVERGRVITSNEKRLEKNEFDRAVRVIRVIRALVDVWSKSQKSAATLSPEPSSEETPMLAGESGGPVADSKLASADSKPVATPPAVAGKSKKPVKK